MEKLSEEIGFSSNYLSAIISSEGGVPPMVSKYIEKIYGIPLDDYKWTSEEEREAEYKADNMELVMSRVLENYEAIDYERLYKVIYSAVYDAVKKAWSE